jgi:DNA-binding IclR family transcriptional regulator
MRRRPERLSRPPGLTNCVEDRRDVIEVVVRAFSVLRCFEDQEVCLGNAEISRRCALPPSTVSRLTYTLTRMGQLTYLPQDQKYRIGLALQLPFFEMGALSDRLVNSAPV